ncbi:Hypothetical_protein [Hexamita inflata]|uniref:Hypothetical_protein n=1 Tax=Hexamita inflata TaxID=28002 RepID=A0AA86RQ76_9EUKA|nr:Hypothetical protein HINF_LOCUS63742 [Hexamita inflata]
MFKPAQKIVPQMQQQPQNNLQNLQLSQAYSADLRNKVFQSKVDLNNSTVRKLQEENQVIEHQNQQIQQTNKQLLYQLNSSKEQANNLQDEVLYLQQKIQKLESYIMNLKRPTLSIASTQYQQLIPVDYYERCLKNPNQQQWSDPYVAVSPKIQPQTKYDKILSFLDVNKNPSAISISGLE